MTCGCSRALSTERFRLPCPFRSGIVISWAKPANVSPAGSARHGATGNPVFSLADLAKPSYASGENRSVMSF